MLLELKRKKNLSHWICAHTHSHSVIYGTDFLLYFCNFYLFFLFFASSTKDAHPREAAFWKLGVREGKLIKIFKNKKLLMAKQQ